MWEALLRADADAANGYGTRKYAGEMGAHHYRRQSCDRCAQSLACPGGGVLDAVVGDRRCPTSLLGWPIWSCHDRSMVHRGGGVPRKTMCRFRKKLSESTGGRRQLG